MKRVYIIIFVIFIFNGCIPKSKHQINLYNISQCANISGTTKVNKILKLRYPLSLGAFGGSRIYYKRGGLTSYYQYSRWSDSLNSMIYKSILETLLKSKKYKDVISYNSSIKADLVLEVNILDFYHIVDNNKSYLLVKIAIKLTDEKSAKLIKSKLFTYKKELKVANAKNLYKVAKELLNNFLIELTEEL